MTERRPRDFSKDSKIAQLLCMVFEIPHADQVRMHELHALSLVEWDHYPVRYIDGGSNHFSNCMPRLIGAHGEKTAKIDLPEIAKGKRLRNGEVVRKFKEAAKVDPEAAAELFPSAARLMRRKGRKLQGRGFSKDQTRGFDGKVRPRKQQGRRL